MRSTTALVLVLAPLAAAQGAWNRRVYFTDTVCTGTIGYQEHVFTPNAPCAGPTQPLTAACEIKSTDARVKSAEATQCESVSVNKDVSELPFFPAAEVGVGIAGANYLTLNVYSAAQVAGACPVVTGGNVQITQITAAADGACHVMEPGMYFKASCTADGGVLEFCNDAQCTTCPTTKRTAVKADCSGDMYQGQPTKAICTLPGAVVAGGNATTSATSSAAASATGSATAAAPSATSAPGNSTGTAKNSGAVNVAGVVFPALAAAGAAVFGI
ncbi:uncharacterized protein EV422DRAFT_583354 [Fimicolochytrium jonesii]|uniref:uncharacterized protein n=1 Tax=Fimicolochytrium jonesii TaxID=1396493 RepID=UPI0022FDFA9A|nr:uncharacterized protein EV422DRAFT_583354 [Fimicolochytrium jonesii]KAI8825906.1 hypothetical protein EV422DRAFT_583354 [Fimicolochytrium jonesii]